MAEPDDSPGATPDPEAAPPPSAGPPPDAHGGSLGLDDAWEQLTRSGRAVVMGAAALLLLAAAIGLGFGLGGSSGDGEGTLVLAETSGSVVTLEVPPPETLPETSPTEEPPQTEESLPALPETTDDPAVPGQPGATESTTPGEPSAGEVRVFTDADGGDIGSVSVGAPSELTWTSEGTTFVLLDRASGATLVDAVESGGTLTLEVGEYDLRVEADGGWTVSIRLR